MLMKNSSDHLVMCEALGFAVKAGDTVEVDDGYCAPRAAMPGIPAQEPIIKLLCPQLVPADPALVEAWKRNAVIVKPAPPPAPTAATFEAEGLSPGVAALAAAGNAEAAPKPPNRRNAAGQGR